MGKKSSKCEEEVKRSIKSFIEELEKKITVEKVILYGSWAKGSPEKFSDIDLAIFSPDFGENKLKELQMLSKLAGKVDKSIEALPYCTFRLDNFDFTSFVNEILETGEVVYCSEE